MPRSYMDNSYNRSLGRVGMPVGSMVVSRGSSGGGGGSSFSSYGGGGGSSYSGGGSSTRTYVDNASNRSIGRVGMPVGSMVVSRSSSGGGDRAYSSSGATPKTYVDNAENRKLGRVGMEHGTAVVPKYDSGSLSGFESSEKTYVDNAHNRRLGRVGMAHGTAVVSKSDLGSTGNSKPDVKTYVDNAYNRRLDRVEKEHGTAVVSRGDTSSLDSTMGKKTYVDNAFNRRHDRVGKELGTFVIPKSDGSQSNVKRYKDNPANRRLGRVGKPIGTAVYSKDGTPQGRVTYVDNAFNRRKGRVGKPRGSMPVQGKSEKTKKTIEIYQHLLNDSFDDYAEGQIPPRGDELDALENALNMYNRRMEEESWEKEFHNMEPPKTMPDILSEYSGTKIDFADIELRRKIGQGGFGEVHFAKWNGSVVAVKKLKQQNVSKRILKSFNDEILTFCDLDHPNIVKFIGACVDRPNLCIVMEYMQMSLFDAIHVNDSIDFAEGERQQIMWQTSDGLKYLHGKNIAHCDLKTQNVLLDYSSGDVCVAKITDFGLSMMKKHSESSASGADELVRNIGTPRYSAPEVLRGEYLRLKEMMLADVYSLGLIMYEVVFEEEPFFDLNYAQLRNQVGDRGRMPTLPDGKIKRAVVALLEKCWSYEPYQRPSMETVCKEIESQLSIYC